MNKFLVLYKASVSATEQMAQSTPAQAKAGMEAWMTWVGRAGPAIVDMGAPLGDPVGVGGTSTGPGHITGYGLVQAESMDAAKALFDAHPHLVMPGASIELMECLSLPGM